MYTDATMTDEDDDALDDPANPDAAGTSPDAAGTWSVGPLTAPPPDVLSGAAGAAAAASGTPGALYDSSGDPDQDALHARLQAVLSNLQATHVDPAQRQADEIENEAVAGAQGKNDADAAFGDQMASRALTRAMAARTGMQRATDAGLLTPEHAMVTRAATSDFLARQQPKEDQANEANQVKMNIAQMQASGRITAAQATELGRTADALYAGGAHIAGSGYGATEPGQQMLGSIQQALQNRQGGGAGGAGTYQVGQYKEGATANGGTLVWHDAGPKGPSWYPVAK